MRFGVFILGDKPNHLSHAQVFANVLEEARWAEEFGYDEIWLAEHHFSPYGSLADLPLVAAAIAAQTDRIRIGTACMVAPFHDPINLAERIAMVDNLSGGRFDAGFGRGYQAHEFKGFGIPMDEATARYQECVEIVNLLLAQENVTYEGKYWQLHDVTIHPRPVQQPIPVWGTVMKTPSSFEWLADKGFGAIIGNPYQVDPDLQGALDIYLATQAKKGLDAATGNVWALLNAFCHTDDAFARTYPRESVELSIETHRKYSSPFERGGEIPADYKAYADWFEKHDKQSYEQVLNSHLTLMGNPDRIIEKMRTVIDMGWRNIILRMSRGGAMDRAKVRDSMKLFAKEVIPAATELTAASA
ncbi:LLM class flavin-dependent oxidoreductase [Mycobacterium shimoidei]|uniref:LLM class flavin-dependent oxidoreductase n=1 Tax=Mycobacterium shimoidei TaxID=29313 RepID=UPI0008487835|nr:LLM class flavin-dependent oxidoreductase [Mycobacterium shimoidei]MCV7257180.1 LLM class flavin-dependent oxidoreductase [Mycobacterium shimoidei]ODR14472.1 luciferase [Mycobacterium shimoidei]ORW80548.1 luciferase [Mycobacterium shimoidei]